MMMRAIDYPITVVFNSGDTAFIILTPYPLLSAQDYTASCASLRSAVSPL